MNKSTKILYFLDYLKKHKKYCTKELALYLDTSIKNIQRYKKEIEEFFNIEFKKYAKGCYLIPDIVKIQNLLINPKDYEDFEKVFDILALSESTFIRFFDLDEKILEKLLNDDIKIYKLKESPLEDLINFHLLKDLKSAIKYRRYLDISYFSDQQYFFKKAKPLKIVFAEGNWYLATITNDPINNGFKFLRINFIKKLEINKDTFQTDYDAIKFLDKFQTLFSSYKKPFYEVKIKVKKDVARYFKVKKFLPSQNIIEETSDGDLIISYKINNENEILFLAKRWLPHITIISPKNLQEKLIDIVKSFLNDK